MENLENWVTLLRFGYVKRKENNNINSNRTKKTFLARSLAHSFNQEPACVCVYVYMSVCIAALSNSVDVVV
jgi:hypothetical protein